MDDLRQPEDIAHAEPSELPGIEEPGPGPLRCALIGLLLGLGAGVAAAILTPRPERARRLDGGAARDDGLG